LEFVSCNLCGADNREPYCKVGEFSIVRCSRCGLLYTNPRYRESEIANIYSEEYFLSKNPSILGYDDYSTHADGLRQVFADHLDIIEQFTKPPASMLDVGCAYGYFCELAAKRGWNTEGLEVSAHAAQMARELAKVPVHTGTLAEVALTPASFDVAAMWDVLEHSFDPSSELAAVNRILKPGGYLFLTLPDAGSFIARLLGPYWFGYKKAAEHNYFFSERTLRQLLARAGFETFMIRRGVWPCSLAFLTTKLEPYSKYASRAAHGFVKILGLEKTVIKFKFIDMFVIARKNLFDPPDDGRKEKEGDSASDSNSRR
jgi:2-polyprenyl-3-methyl-5-hydroxy-6-metoxy-1,4-benzoquinol methylase